MCTRRDLDEARDGPHLLSVERSAILTPRRRERDSENKLYKNLASLNHTLVRIVNGPVIETSHGVVEKLLAKCDERSALGRAEPSHPTS